MLGASQEQSRWDHVMGIVTNLQKRVYALEHELQKIQRTKDKRK